MPPTSSMSVPAVSEHPIAAFAHGCPPPQLPKPVAASRAVLRLGEGGLTRFKMLGTPLPAIPQRVSLLEYAIRLDLLCFFFFFFVCFGSLRVAM